MCNLLFSFLNPPATIIIFDARCFPSQPGEEIVIFEWKDEMRGGYVSQWVISDYITLIFRLFVYIVIVSLTILVVLVGQKVGGRSCYLRNYPVPIFLVFFCYI